VSKTVAHRHHGTGGCIRTHIHQARSLYGRDAAIGIYSCLYFEEIVPTMAITRQCLASIRDPFHRPCETARRFKAQNIFSVDTILLTEAAAGVRSDYAHTGTRNPKDVVRKRALQDLHALRGYSECEASFVIRAYASARFQRRRIDAVADEGGFHTVRSPPQLLGDSISVALVILENRWRALKACHSRQRLEVACDRFRGIARLSKRVRDHECEDVTDKPHAILR
jgi:hypothetical protein